MSCFLNYVILPALLSILYQFLVMLPADPAADIISTESRKLSKVTGYRLKDWGSIPGRVRDIFLHCHVQTGSRAHPVSYIKCSGEYLTGSTAAGA